MQKEMNVSKILIAISIIFLLVSACELFSFIKLENDLEKIQIGMTHSEIQEILKEEIELYPYSRYNDKGELIDSGGHSMKNYGFLQYLGLSVKGSLDIYFSDFEKKEYVVEEVCSIGLFGNIVEKTTLPSTTK